MHDMRHSVWKLQYIATGAESRRRIPEMSRLLHRSAHRISTCWLPTLESAIMLVVIFDTHMHGMSPAAGCVIRARQELIRDPGWVRSETHLFLTAPLYGYPIQFFPNRYPLTDGPLSACPARAEF